MTSQERPQCSLCFELYNKMLCLGERKRLLAFFTRVCAAVCVLECHQLKEGNTTTYGLHLIFIVPVPAWALFTRVYAAVCVLECHQLKGREHYYLYIDLYCACPSLPVLHAPPLTREVRTHAALGQRSKKSLEVARLAWRCLLSSSPMNYFCWN